MIYSLYIISSFAWLCGDWGAISCREPNMASERVSHIHPITPLSFGLFHKLPATEQSTSLIRFSRRRIHSLPPLHSTRRTVALPSSFCLWDMQAQAKWVDRSPKSWLGYVYPASLSASKSTDLVSMSRISWIRSRVLVFLDPFFEIRQEAAQEMEIK